MKAVLLAFASVRERAGWARKEVDLLEGDTPLSLWERHLGGAPDAVAPVVGLAFTGWDHSVKDGDEVGFLPPVAGGR